MSFDFGNANTNQKEAIRSTEGPLLIIAGPGTGKTFTLVKRIVYLITQKNVKPEEILVATFTEKAAKEIVTRITNELYKIGIQININEMYIGTFHSICLRILKEHLEYTRIKKNYRMVDQFEQQYFIFQHINEFKKCQHIWDVFDASKQGTWRLSASISSYVNGITEELVDVSKMRKDGDQSIVGVAELIDTYTRLADKENLIDFSSIQTETYKLLTEHSEILDEIKKQIRYLMVDEYQDTNYIQEQLLFLLAGKEQNICVVGDDDQGLYRFRGATIRNILEFPSHFPKGKCKQITLAVNYRSEKDIIDFYNTWIGETGKNFEWKNFRFPKKIVPGKKGYSTHARVVTCSGTAEKDDWADKVYDFIQHLKNEEILNDYNQIAVLCRSVKNEKVVALMEKLEEKGIPVYSPRSNQFFKRKEIQEILGCFIICFPDYFDKLETEDFTFSFPDLYAYYRNQCVVAARRLLRKYPDLKIWCTKMEERHSFLRNNTDYAYSGMLYQLLGMEPFSSYVGIAVGNGVFDERPARNIAILSSSITKFEYLHNIEVLTPKNIIRQTEMLFNMYFRFLIEGGIDEYEDDKEYAPSGCISFMTIHQSKGMEFPIVFVDSLSSLPRSQNDGLLLDIGDKYFKRKPFEEIDKIKYFDFWRLFYTAFSRAQNLLVLTCSEKAGRGKTPSAYFEKMYKGLKPWNQVDLSDLQLEDVKPVNIKETYSFTSHIEVYENCSLQYKFFKELGFSQIRVGATLFGTLIHETIEDVHRAAMRHEENTITADNIRTWLDTNYDTLSKSEHAYLGKQQIDVAYDQVLKYVDRMEKGIGISGDGSGNGPLWHYIQDAEMDVSLVKNDYILKGTVDLITGEKDTVELVDFKSEKKPEDNANVRYDRYKRQLEVYAHLVEEKIGKKVSKMHLYYTGDDSGNPVVTFNKSQESIDKTIKGFDEVVHKIQNHEFTTKSNDKKQCQNCDLRYHCGKVSRKGEI